MIDFMYIWLPIVFAALFIAAILCIVLGITGLGSEDDADRMPCGHPQSAARYADGDRGGTGYCVECAREAEKANNDRN